MSLSRTLFLCAIVCVAVTAILAPAASAQPLTGAIFTTDENGTVVNGNVYDDCCDVYLNGGPPPNAPCDSAGLPDGEYYFQVTDPSGAVLLSSDSIDKRRVRIEDGLIVEYLGGKSKPCKHKIGEGKCQAINPANISVQLMPFSPTPNPGGVHKAWMTRVSDYAPGDPSSVHGFLHHRSKTDNFKCEQKEATCDVFVQKYHDANGNGTNDGEYPLDGVRIDVCYTPPGGVETCVTLATGSLAPGEAALQGIPLGSSVVVCEQIPGTGDSNCTWMQTEPNAWSQDSILDYDQWCYAFDLPADGPCGVTTLQFGDVCVCFPGEGKTLGFWSNPNGKAILQANHPAWKNLLNACCLRKADGSHYDIPNGSFTASFDNFRSWLLGANASNMAHMLSAQMSATKLNVTFGGLSGTASVSLPGSLAACYGADTAQINDVIAAADAALCADGYTPSGDPNRADQECLKNILDGINNNAFPIAITEPCDVVYPSYE